MTIGKSIYDNLKIVSEEMAKGTLFGAVIGTSASEWLKVVFIFNQFQNLFLQTSTPKFHTVDIIDCNTRYKIDLCNARVDSQEALYIERRSFPLLCAGAGAVVGTIKGVGKVFFNTMGITMRPIEPFVKIFAFGAFGLSVGYVAKIFVNIINSKNEGIFPSLFGNFHCFSVSCIGVSCKSPEYMYTENNGFSILTTVTANLLGVATLLLLQLEER